MDTDTIMMASLMMGMATLFYYAGADGVFGAAGNDLADALYPIQDPEDPFGQRPRRR